MLSRLQLKSLVTFLYLSSSVLAIPVLEEKKTSCTTPEGTGTCQLATSCTSTGFNIAGYCPGNTSSQCCISRTCQSSTGATGLCLNISDNCTDGSFIAGFCPGSGVQCCVKDSETSDPSYRQNAEKRASSGKKCIAGGGCEEGDPLRI
ncbi:putative glycoside hydrolase family 25 protein [Botrytis fragariae]|uniref:Putative glycoside hydrolase family 25 protein n=1 Tax=Botrytis fragariae TaxID=1964551 RepID=A0A8H6AXW5_9HELO|nr:putative glycoside hydrolase family 25 protein [Botrytis fragariae]KAF5875542.1 putative glycoside hydrolase family 25 protein [Botrytis fragariae]